MVKLRICMIAALCLASVTACAVGPPKSASAMPTTEVDAGAYKPPLAGTNVDEKAIKVAFVAYDAVLTAVDGAVKVGALVPGSATALKVQGFLTLAKASLNAAFNAQQAGNEPNALKALESARAAFLDLKLALKGGG